MKFDDVKKLSQKKYRQEFGHFLIEGEHLVLELAQAARRNPLLAKSEVYVTRAHERWESGFTQHVLGDAQMAQISDTQKPQGIVAVVPIVPPRAPVADERCVYLHEIQDPGNLGTILRTLAWFGAFRCLLSPDSVDPHNAKVVRASMGGIFHVPVETDVPLASLGQRFKRIGSLSLQGESTASDAFAQCDCFVFGNEARGLPTLNSAALPVRAFTIGGGGTVESLNLAAVVNMCAYELNRSRCTAKPSHT